MTTKHAVKMVTVCDGTIWRSESGDTRVSKLGSTWAYTVKRFIGGESREEFPSRAAMLRWLKSRNVRLNFN